MFFNVFLKNFVRQRKITHTCTEIHCLLTPQLCVKRFFLRVQTAPGHLYCSVTIRILHLYKEEKNSMKTHQHDKETAYSAQYRLYWCQTRIRHNIIIIIAVKVFSLKPNHHRGLLKKLSRRCGKILICFKWIMSWLTGQ